MHQWQKFGENPSTDTGDIAETWNYHVNHGRTHGRTHGQRHGRTTRKHIASAGACRRRRLNNHCENSPGLFVECRTTQSDRRPHNKSINLSRKFACMLLSSTTTDVKNISQTVRCQTNATYQVHPERRRTSWNHQRTSEDLCRAPTATPYWSGV